MSNDFLRDFYVNVSEQFEDKKQGLYNATKAEKCLLQIIVRAVSEAKGGLRIWGDLMKALDKPSRKDLSCTLWEQETIFGETLDFKIIKIHLHALLQSMH